MTLTKLTFVFRQNEIILCDPSEKLVHPLYSILLEEFPYPTLLMTQTPNMYINLGIHEKCQSPHSKNVAVVNQESD